MLLRLRLRTLRAFLPPTIKEGGVGHEATNELALGSSPFGGMVIYGRFTSMRRDQEVDKTFRNGMRRF